MKTILLVVAAITITAISVNAQGAKFSIAANAGIPTAQGFKFAYGADVQADFHVANNLSVTASAGYENFHWKVSGTTTSYSGNVSQIPLLGGLKYVLTKGLYAHGQLGYAVKGSSGNYLMPNDNGFAFAISGGYATGSWDIGVKYLATHPGGSDLGAVVARFAYTLGK